MFFYKKKKTSYIFLISISLILILIPLDKKNYENYSYFFLDKIMSYDLGFSRLQGAAGGSLRDFGNLKNLIYKSPNIFHNYFNGVEGRPNLKTLRIKINFKNYQKILEDRQKALKQGNTYEFRTVNAKLFFDEQKASAKIRLKGLLSDHWRSPHRMSLKIRIKDRLSFLGFREFFIHKPVSRQHPYNQVYNDIIKRTGNISINQNYIRVVVNNIDWGVMNIEEAVNKDFLEKQNLKDSIIIEFKDPDLSVSKSKKYLSNTLNRKFYSYVSSQHLSDRNDIYDIDSFSKTLLTNIIWGDNHPLMPSNSKYYFNPFSLKIYPISRDQSSIKPIDTTRYKMPYIYKKIYKDIKFQESLKKNTNFVQKQISEHSKYFKKWKSYFPLDFDENTEILKDNNKKISNNLNKYLSNYFDKSYKTIVPKKENFYSLHNFIFAKHFDNGEIYIYNLVPFDIELIDISLGDRVLKFNNQKIKTSIIKNKFIPTIIKTNFIGIHDNNIMIRTKLDENIKEFKTNYSYLMEGLDNPLLNNTDLTKIKYIQKINIKTWKIKNGFWDINQPLVIDGNLDIAAGTQLNFSKDSFLIVKGRLNIEGTADQKVVMHAQSNNKSWKGIYVFDSDEKSLIKNTVIKDIDFLNQGLLSLTGGVTFYKSDVEMIDVNISNSYAEDALNIIKSNFMIDNLSLNNTRSDGIDSDFSSGTIINSKFKNIGGDALDFSGSKANVSNINFVNIHDKAVSSGENSSVILKNLIVENTGIGVASKDGSLTKIQDLIIKDYKLSALMTYNKKAFYEYPKMIGTGIKFYNSPNALIRQKNSTMLINGSQIREQDVNVKLLYQSDVMKKNGN